MSKRKGSDLAAAPPTPLIISSSSPPPSYHSMTPKSSETKSSSTTPIISKSSSNLSWDETMTAASEVLQLYRESASSTDISTVEKCISLSNELTTKRNDILKESQSIHCRIQKSIERATNARQMEWKEFRNEIDRVSELEHDLNEIQQKLDGLDINEKECVERTRRYKMEAEEELEEMDEVEVVNMRRVRKLKCNISLLASITGIKWDYDKVDLLAGEVDIPSKCEHRRFEIDPSDYTKVEVANLLWDMMDGEQIASTTVN